MVQDEFNPVQEYNGIIIDYSRDKIIPEQGKSMLTKKGFYKKDHERSPQQTFARASVSYCFGDYEFAQRIYDYASKQWFTFASPVLSNAMDVMWPTFSNYEFEIAGDWLEDNITPEGMPISCNLVYVPDNKKGLVESRSEAAWLSMMGAGIGIYMGNRSPDEKSTGVMSHLRGYDSDALSYKQTASRRGSIAAYLDIDHPEIMAFIEMRKPTGGDSNKKCFNLNNAVNITDDFMHKVISGDKYELRDPKHGPTGQFLDAREVWELLMESRYETGEPYIMFKDTVNRNIPEWITHPFYNVDQSNLCVAPETQILTDRGYQPIAELEDQEVNVWNGEEFSSTVVKKTGENQKLIKVVTESGYELECTPYHKFYIFDGYWKNYKEVKAHELQAGDKLSKFDLPVVDGGESLNKAYINGFYSGDGTTVGNTQVIYLYHEKRGLEYLFGDMQWYHQEEYNRQTARFKDLKDKFFVPTTNYTVQSRLDWLAGYADADGCIYRNGDNQQLVFTSIEKSFMSEIQLMLQTLGVSAKVQPLQEEGFRKLPANDGTGEMKDYWCKEAYRLIITSCDLFKLVQLGFKTHRLQIVERRPQRDAKRFVKIESVTDHGRTDDTYCFNEPKRHMGMFNGILTGQCSEITLKTNEKRTAVCCLSSLNLDKFDEWKDTQIVEDLIRLLDNVLEYYIRLAPPELSRAVHSAIKERAVGLGTLGWHSYLQSKMIPFESGGFGSAIQETNRIYSMIKERAVNTSKQLASERGEPSDVRGSGMRSSHLLAIAPNASSASIVGASPSIEPWNSNAFNAQGRAGSFLIKNKYLEKVLIEHGKNTHEIWKSITLNSGSVQHLDFLSDLEKQVFKTAYEMSPMWIVEQAGQRQKYICQSQSLNIFVTKDVTLEQMSDIHMKGWLSGVKTFYYCRGEPETRAQVGTGGDKPLNAIAVKQSIEFDECLSCQA